MNYLVVKKNTRCTLSALGGEEKKRSSAGLLAVINPGCSDSAPAKYVYMAGSQQKSGVMAATSLGFVPLATGFVF